MHLSNDTLNPPQSSEPCGPYDHTLEQLDARLEDLYSILAGLACKLQGLCQNIRPILDQLNEAMSRVDAATAKSLPALLQAISRGGRQGAQHCQSVHELALQQQENAEKILTNVSGMFTSVCASTADVLGHLVTVLLARASLDRPPAGRGGVAAMQAVWWRALEVASQAGSLCALQYADERSAGSAWLREESARFGLVLAMSHELADELMALAM